MVYICTGIFSLTAASSSGQAGAAQAAIRFGTNKTAVRAAWNALENAMDATS
ncbi:hypothetical protein PR003_g22248 [Phytophthora rubi]|uniref:Uncharacterized protein n=1 Tax=Phytophthora rubi TaxID=129364 RepID=A0A6A3J3V0_9STRA|nr:hypothetical protein PR002_g21600 [Phytophthora rubi]KAE8991890.1 hypothetical protein PR001_g21100 [Phytophthora rubi]KAE9302505.1 hypothetical protein PR003_g22248 [Phytophthora rubi]